MSTPVTEAEIFAVLYAIERGEIALEPIDDPREIFAGDVRYRASNGWTLTVFNDCNEWDYLDSVTLPDGRSLNTYDALESWIDAHPPRLGDNYGDEPYRALANYSPPAEVSRRIYRIGDWPIP